MYPIRGSWPFPSSSTLCHCRQCEQNAPDVVGTVGLGPRLGRYFHLHGTVTVLPSNHPPHFPSICICWASPPVSQCGVVTQMLSCQYVHLLCYTLHWICQQPPVMLCTHQVPMAKWKVHPFLLCDSPLHECTRYPPRTHGHCVKWVGWELSELILHLSLVKGGAKKLKKKKSIT